jgi:hypothetical protein
MSRNRFFAVCCGVLAAVPPVLAGDSHEHREHGAHVHGIAQLNVAVDGSALLIELDSPAANILGFEHAPRTDAQRAAVDDARVRLADGAALFRPSVDAGCVLAEHEIDLTLGAEDAEHEHEAEQAHEHAAEHAHAHEGDAEVHSDIHAEYRFECEAPSALQALDLRLFEVFPATEQLRVQVITPAGQRAAELSAGSTELRL